MKRAIKNIIMAALILGMVGVSIFTMNCAKSSFTSNRGDIQKSNMGTPPQMAQGESGNNENGQDVTNSEDETTNNSSQSSDGEMQTPPQSSDGEMQTPPQGSDGQMQNPPQGGNGQMNGNGRSFGMKLSAGYYVIFGLEGLIIALLSAYLIMSLGNKKKLKDTFKGSKNIIVYIAIVVVLTAALTAADGLVTTKAFMKGGPSMGVPGEMGTQSDSGNVSENASGAKEITGTETLSGTYTSSKSDESAILVSAVGI